LARWLSVADPPQAFEWSFEQTHGRLFSALCLVTGSRQPSCCRTAGAWDPAWQPATAA